MIDLANIRSEYSKSNLDQLNVHLNPIKQFELWFKEAIDANVNEPNAMNLATVTGDGRPVTRIVLLKGIEKDQFVFFTNYQSDKGKELQRNPACCLNFFWPELERQVRVEGITQKVDSKTSDDYFQSRPIVLVDQYFFLQIFSS